jgi:hypothetical protein
MQAIQNIGLASVSLLSGLIVDHYGYIFVFWLVLASLATVLLWLVDYHSEIQFLNMSTVQRKALDKKVREKAEAETAKLLASRDNYVF